MQGAEYLSKDDGVTLFYSQHCAKVEKGKLQQIIEAGSNLDICRLRHTGRNAMDFYIACKIGELFGSGYQGIVAIVSGDKGYSAVQDYWTCCAEPVRRVVLRPNIEQCIGCSGEGSERERLIQGKLQEVDLDMQYEISVELHEIEKQEKGKMTTES